MRIVGEVNNRCEAPVVTKSSPAIVKCREWGRRTMAGVEEVGVVSGDVAGRQTWRCTTNLHDAPDAKW